MTLTPAFVLRRAAFALLVLGPASADVVARSLGRAARYGATGIALLAVSVLASVAFWSALASRTSPRGRALLGVCIALLVALHVVVWTEYSAAVTPGLVEQASHHGSDVWHTLWAARRDLLLRVGPLLVAAASLGLVAAPPALLAERGARWRAALLVPLPLLALTPSTLPTRTIDAQVVQSAAVFGYRLATKQVRPARAASSVPFVPALAGNDLSLLFIVSESLRADSYCISHGPPCTVSPSVDAALPERIGLTQLRTVAAWTIVSLAVLTTGCAVDTPRADLDAAPNLFEYARASGRTTSYLSAQKLEHLYLRVAEADFTSTFEDLSRDSEYEGADRDVTRLLVERFARSGRPELVLLHLGDTHAPYAVDPDDAPFRPYGRAFGWDDTPLLKNQYLNGIHRQDALLGRALRELRDRGALDRTVVVFTSDHGEAFREHAQLLHGGSLHDEELHVPGWIWLPPAARQLLGPRVALLEREHGRFSTHLDVLPTLLDLMGVLDDPALAPFRGRLPGQSLLREAAPQFVVQSNCGPLMDCAFKTWGLARAERQIEAREWDGYWNCWDRSREPALPLPMAEGRCQELLIEARGRFARLPNGGAF